MSRPVLALTVATALTFAAGCAGSSAGALDTDPPGDPPATTTSPSPTPSPVPRGPRTVLQSFLRGIANDDPTVCRDVSIAYDRSQTDGFGAQGGCVKALANDARLMRTKQVKQLDSVEVVNGVAGPTPGEFTVTFSDLRWPAGRLTLGVLAVQYVLAKLNGKWKIVG